MPAVRLRIRPDRSSLLVGINYHDLRSILTLADLEAMASLDRARKSLQSGSTRPREDQEALDHYTHMRTVIQQGLDAMHDAFTRSYNEDPHAPPAPLNSLTKEQRWRRVQQEAAFNKMLDGFMDSIKQQRSKKEDDHVG